MNDGGLLTWDPFVHGQFLIVHWKEDLPLILIVGFWFSVLIAYMYWKDRKTKKANQSGDVVSSAQHPLNARELPPRRLP